MFRLQQDKMISYFQIYGISRLLLCLNQQIVVFHLFCKPKFQTIVCSQLGLLLFRKSRVPFFILCHILVGWEQPLSRAYREQRHWCWH